MVTAELQNLAIDSNQGHLFDIIKVHVGLILEILSRLKDTIASKITTQKSIDEEEIKIEIESV